MIYDACPRECNEMSTQNWGSVPPQWSGSRLIHRFIMFNYIFVSAISCQYFSGSASIIGAVVGGVVGGIAALVLAVVVVMLVYLFCCRDKSKGEFSLFLILYCLAPSALAVFELVVKAFVCDCGLKVTFLIYPQDLV